MSLCNCSQQFCYYVPFNPARTEVYFGHHMWKLKWWKFSKFIKTPQHWYSFWSSWDELSNGTIGILIESLGANVSFLEFFSKYPQSLKICPALGVQYCISHNSKLLSAKRSKFDSYLVNILKLIPKTINSWWWFQRFFFCVSEFALQSCLEQCCEYGCCGYDHEQPSCL
jgi:hypothetical protein